MRLAKHQVKLEDSDVEPPYDTSSYRHKIHAAALGSSSLLADSDIEIDSSPPKYSTLEPVFHGTVAEEYITSPRDTKPDIDLGLPAKLLERELHNSSPRRSLRRSETTSDASFELSRQASQIDYNRYSSSASLRLSSDDGSGESPPQIQTPNPDTPLQSDKYLLKFYKDLARQLEGERNRHHSRCFLRR